MKFCQLDHLNKLSRQLATFRELSAKAAVADMCQFLCSERRESDGDVVYVRNREFMLQFKKFVDEQVALTIKAIEALGVENVT